MCTNNSGSVPRIMVFRPSMEEMKDFPAYITKIESQGANKAGLAKIIPPKEWCPRAAGYDDIDLDIPAPISQVVHGRQGLYQQINIQKKSITVKDFQILAESEKYRTPNHFDYEDLERKYWRNITFNTPIYGADVSGSLYDTHVTDFNINHLQSILDLVNEDYGIKIEGVNTAYLYFGMWKTTFPWHTEDMDLYSINYLHFGAPKSWYAIPPEHGRRLERLATGFFPGNSKSCPAFLRHKMTIISPAVLKQYSIPFNKITQEPGEFMVTFPFGYHAGFNHGFNCAESTNFAMPRWVEYGKRALQCSCRKDGVKISMDVFVSKYQPERYDLWKMGKDVGAHPEDPSRVYAAPPPTKMELTASARAEERRRYRTDCVSKRHPISHMEGKDEDCAKDDTQSDDTEIYDIGEVVPDAQKKKKRKKKEKTDVAVKEKVKKVKKKKEGNPDKVKVKKKEKKKVHADLLPKPTSFDAPEDLTLGNSPMKLIISKKRVPSTSDAPEFEVKLAQPHFPPNIAEQTIKKISLASDNSNLMALAQLAEDVGVRMDLSHCLTSQEGSASHTKRALDFGYQLPQHHVVKSEHKVGAPKSNLLGSVSILRKQMNSKARSLLNSEPKVSLTPISAGAINMFQQKVDPPASLKSWSQNKNIPIYLPLPATAPSANGHQKPFVEFSPPLSGRIASVATSVQENFQEHCSIKTEHSLPEKVESTSPPSVVQASAQHLADFRKSLQKETCLYETGHVPQVAHMHQHQKIQKLLHDYARTESDKDSVPEVLNLSKKCELSEVPLEGWAKPLTNLWKFRPPDFEAEKAFNMSSASTDPHCAICTIFKALRTDMTCEEVKVPSSSKVLMPGSIFSSSTVNQFVVDSNPLLAPDGTAPLLTCSNCRVCVHATCYGIGEHQFVSDWRCMRCSEGATDVACCLCPLRGGALKRTVDGRWAHISCAALVPGAFFGSVVTKEPVDLSKIKRARLKLICMYCHKFAPKDSGVCIQCSSGKCSLSFHVTCGHAAGVVFDTSNWPTPVFITCTRHITSKDKKEENRSFVEVRVGDKAVAKYRNKRYYNCEVQKIDKHIFYAVDFEDGSFSENLFAQDIVSHNCTAFGPPKINESVEVQWTDGNRYNAFFKGTKTQVIYTVEFENGEQLQLKRDDFYTSNEELPKRVLSRMSTATDGQHTDIFDEEVDGKRTRFVNTKYHSDDVVTL